MIARNKKGTSITGMCLFCEEKDSSLYGAGTRNRTGDLLITSQLLYRLSYAGQPNQNVNDKFSFSLCT